MSTDPTLLHYVDESAFDRAIAPATARRAVQWLVELQAADVSPAVLDAWRCWRAAHPDHERAWQRIESVNGRLRHLASPVSAAIAQATLAPPASPRRRRAIATLTVLLFAGGATYALREEMHWREWAADYRTARGERRTLVLDDGTSVVLNTATAIDVRFSTSERRVRLLAGEVFITTGHDVVRPFLVETAQGEARALGTRYTVRLQDAATDVAVFDGAVRLVPRAAVTQAQLLQAGQRVSFTADAVASPMTADRDSAAWTDGFLVARSMRLDDFVAELARHSTRSLFCDPAVAGLRVSGTYPLRDIDHVLETVAGTLSLRVETVTRFWGLQAARVGLAPQGVSPGGRS